MGRSERPSDDLRAERLRIHRELQLLRAAAWQPRRGTAKGGGIARKRAWVKERARKLDQSERKPPSRERS